ncbi:MAG TPA: D-glycero-beta-D-manno-heptose 1-phosphate adenylyltransferase, partial [Desulfobacteraceae bacterium]|nr:D-glycero-beta-D-manno-heptose 1-phosphate adenylyltransferase [Desulfobacteraceae bacterium]
MKEFIDKIKPLSVLKERLEGLRKEKIIVFTNGCFDILHPGHIRYLYEAKRLGDILVVGVNSDDSIRRIKGEQRPIMDERARSEMLSVLPFVDFITIFDEDTPYNLIKEIRPHILVKGGDWEEDRIVGADIVRALGGRVVR